MPADLKSTAPPDELAEGFWESEDGQSVRAGLRLDRALPHFLGQRIEFSSDDDIEEFYGTDSRSEFVGRGYEAVRAVVMSRWPQ